MPSRNTPISGAEEDEAVSDVEVVEVRNRERSRRYKPQLFEDEGCYPIGFYFHKSVTATSKNGLSKLIREYGGEVCSTDRGADTVLVGPSYQDGEGLEWAYSHSDDPILQEIYVEGTSFIKECIGAGRFKHMRKRYPMRGVASGQGRNPFTPEEEDKLCEYLARCTPDKASGGRMGIKLYEQMVAMANHMPEHYRWVKRHSPESWKQHYKNPKNRKRLDNIIEKLAQENPPTQKQRFQYDRQLTKAARKNRQRENRWEGSVSTQSEEDYEQEDEAQEEELGVLYQKEGGQDRNPNKRRTSDHESVRIAKKARTLRSSETRAPNSQSKGKERALEEESDSEEEHGTSMISIENDDLTLDEPASADRTLAEPSTSRRTEALSGCFENTQATLVNSPAGNSHLNYQSRHDARFSARKSAVSASSQPTAFPQASSSRVVVKPAQIPVKMARRRGFVRATTEETSPLSKRANTETPGPIGETFEEMDVALQLTRDEQSTASNSATSMDTDDAKNARSIRAAPPPSSKRLVKRPSEFRKELADSSSSRQKRQSMLPTKQLALPQPRMSTDRARQSKPLQQSNWGNDIQIMSSIPSPQTPAPRTRQGSTSSVESSFPASGTKASDLKRILQLQEKHAPYTPPQGTRAAAALHATRR